MSIYEFSVKRPVTITMLTLLAIGLGIYSYFKMPQELFPSVTFPQLTVVTPYTNAAPVEIENLVTKIIEESIATVKHLKSIRSYSREGYSMVICEFDWGTDMNFASLNLREKIDLVKERLPREAEEPLVLRFNPFAKPILIYSMTTDTQKTGPGSFSLSDLLEIAKTRLKDKLEKVDGVASIDIRGGQSKQIQVDLNLDQLRAQGINILDIPNAIKDTNLNYPAGTVKEDFFELLVRTLGEYDSLDDIGNTLISIEKIKKGRYDQKRRKEAQKKGLEDPESAQDISSQYIKLSDVAKIYEDFKEIQSYSRVMGSDNISLSVQSQPKANVIKTCIMVQKEINRIKHETNILPPGVNLDLIYDQSTFIETSINGVIKSALYGGILAFIVLYLFLNSFKNALIVSMSIPISIAVVFICMALYRTQSDFSINMMSLGGLALGIGMLVDNAIVVIENISRYRTLGKSLHDAAVQGTQEIFGAIFSSTLTTVVVFFPLSFVVGIAGELFKPISFTIIFSLLASLLVSITVIPRMSIIKLGGQIEIDEEGGHFMRKISQAYAQFLSHTLKWFKTISTIIIPLFLGSIYLMSIQDKEVMPKIDQGQFRIDLTLPTGTQLSRTNLAASLIETEVLKLENVKNVAVAVGSDTSSGLSSLNSLRSHQAEILVELKKERNLSTKETMYQVNDMIKSIQNSKNHPSLNTAEILLTAEDNMLAGAFKNNADIGIEIKGQDFDEMKRIVDDVETLLKRTPGVEMVRNDIPSKSPEIKIKVKKDRAALLGVTVSDVAKTAMISLKGIVASQLKKDGKEKDILVRLRDEDRNSSEAIENISLFDDDLITPLKEVTNIQKGLGPSEITRLDQIRIYRVFADVKDRPIDEVREEVAKKIKAIPIKDNYFVGFGKEFEEEKASNRSIMIAFLISVVLVYMIMAAMFESFYQPFIIMFTVPLSVIGVAISLVITGTSLNAMSMLGLIMLAGIVVNNGIVLIQFMNDLQAEGKDILTAVITGSRTRLRPILMTTATTLLGLLPLALQLEEGSEMQAPLAIAVIGGLFISTCLTLIVIPATYYYSELFLARLKTK